MKLSEIKKLYDDLDKLNKLLSSYDENECEVFNNVQLYGYELHLDFHDSIEVIKESLVALYGHCGIKGVTELEIKE